MTAVARLSINGYPLIVGDLLVSGQESTDRAKEIPTIDNLLDIFPKGSGFVPCDLSQKIAIINDNLAVGWAGRRISARIVLKNLFEMSKDRLISLNYLKKYFDSLSESIRTQGVKFVGFIKDRDKLSYFRMGSTKLIRTKLFGEVDLLGTGSGRVDNFLKQFSVLPKASTPGAVTKSDLAISFGLALSGCFLNLELATRQSLYEFYGGGYEIATFVDNRFQKLDDVTYLFWSACVNDKKILISKCPNKAFKYTYFKDVLAIRSATFEELQDGEFKVSNARTVDIVPPMYRRLTKSEVNNFFIPPLNSRWLCNCFFVTTPDKTIEIMVLVDFRTNNESLIRFNEQDDKLIFSIHKSYIDLLAKEMASHFWIQNK